MIRLVLFLLLYGCPAVARTTDVLNRHITVRFWQTPLKEALVSVAEKGGFEWSYNANIIDATRRISLVANGWTVRETLYELLGDGYEFKTNGNYLILKKRKPADNQIFGYIKNRRTGEPVVNATVYDRNSLRATTTDSNGYYRLKVTQNAPVAIVSRQFRDTVFTMQSLVPPTHRFDWMAGGTDRIAAVSPQKRRETTAMRFFHATINAWHDLNVPDSLHRRFQISLLPMVGTNHTLSGKVINNWSVNILVGTALGNRVLEVGGLGNFTRKNVQGVQIGGIFNEIGGNVHGIQAAGIYNLVVDTVRGMQGAGIFNHAPKGQLAVQVAGIVNRAESVVGVQAAGLVNHADSVQGVQVAGLVNRSRKVKGVQFGLYNVAGELHGLQIGLINRSGRRVLPILNW
jgi:hypothetical protein